MEQVGVLLLDFDADGGIGIKLRDILDSSPASDIRLKFRRYSNIRPDGNNDEVYGLIRSGTASLILLAVPGTLLNQIDQLVRRIRETSAQLPVVLAIDNAPREQLVELLKLGIADFITPPLKDFEVLARIGRLAMQVRKDETVKQALKEKLGLQQLIGKSEVFLTEISKVSLLAKSNVSVLILGETGTGKEMIARSIHYLSQRANKPFMPLNCGAIPLDLVENELFGHERGAYTSASGQHHGLIQQADGGTLFLDEIDSLPLLAQVKLLRFLQHKEYRPLGSTKVLNADVRIIAASNANLEQAVAEGKIRQDLYYRLNVIPVRLPPLRERPEDVVLLAEHFLAKYAAEFSSPAQKFSAEAIRKLMLYDWPGNVRELEHLVQRAVVLCDQTVIDSTHISIPGSQEPLSKESFQEAKTRMISQFEKSYIQKLLIAHQGNISRAADAAQKERRTFWGLIRKHKINVQKFKAGQF
ncbi:MAG TPA: sigma-54 dependent transcriptional regulator [Blastocatellia bacterium]|nr:sigma-54 dependent transcriptional regulator [Blastocatellia bacterium]